MGLTRGATTLLATSFRISPVCTRYRKNTRSVLQAVQTVRRAQRLEISATKESMSAMRTLAKRR